MPTVVLGFNSDPVEAAYASAALRVERARQRREMRDLSPREAVTRIIEPSYELGSLTLEHLLVPTKQHQRPIPGFGRAKFERVLKLLRDAGHTWAHPRKRLGELTRYQRELLAAALLAKGPKKWRTH